jgi:hypothetical protein
MTVAPDAIANWVASEPTPPEAPSTRTMSPSDTPNVSITVR